MRRRLRCACSRTREHARGGARHSVQRTSCCRSSPRMMRCASLMRELRCGDRVETRVLGPLYFPDRRVRPRTCVAGIAIDSRGLFRIERGERPFTISVSRLHGIACGPKCGHTLRLEKLTTRAHPQHPCLRLELRRGCACQEQRGAILLVLPCRSSLQQMRVSESASATRIAPRFEAGRVLAQQLRREVRGSQVHRPGVFARDRAHPLCWDVEERCAACTSPLGW